MLGIDYHALMSMPVKRFHDLLKWKSDLEEEKQKQLEQNYNK